jgi:DNA gyrase/topoisomerase IV subunit B
MKALLLKRAYDACAVTDASVTIFINKVKHQEIPQLRRTLHRKKDDNGGRQNFAVRYNWEIIATSWTHQNRVASADLGGKHVDYVLNQITKKASDLINKRNKDNQTTQHVKDNRSLYSRERSRTPSSTARRGDSDMPVTKFQREDRSFGQVRGRP